MIFGRFGRESTVLKNGRYIKDLTYMNRPLKDIIYLDFTDDPVELHRENAIIIPKFEGDTSDRNLHDLIPFLDRKFNLQFLSHFQTFFCRFGKVPR